MTNFSTEGHDMTVALMIFFILLFNWIFGGVRLDTYNKENCKLKDSPYYKFLVGILFTATCLPLCLSSTWLSIVDSTSYSTISIMLKIFTILLGITMVVIAILSFFADDNTNCDIGRDSNKVWVSVVALISGIIGAGIALFISNEDDTNKYKYGWGTQLTPFSWGRRNKISLSSYNPESEV